MLSIVAQRFFSAAAPIVTKQFEQKMAQIILEKQLGKKAIEVLGDITKKEIVWKPSKDVLHPYHAEVAGEHVKLRMNDFPEEPLYTVMHDNKELFHINDFMKNWVEHQPAATAAPTPTPR